MLKARFLCKMLDLALYDFLDTAQGQFRDLGSIVHKVLMAQMTIEWGFGCVCVKFRLSWRRLGVLL